MLHIVDIDSCLQYGDHVGGMVWRIEQNKLTFTAMLTYPGRFMLLISLIPSVQFPFKPGIFYVKQGRGEGEGESGNR
jgi:hypothetical protein